MRSEQTRLSDFSKAIRGSTLKRLKAVPDDLVHWRPVDGAMRFADIGQHLIDADRWLFAKVAEPSLTSMKGVSGTAEMQSREGYVRLLAELLKSGEERAAFIAGLRDSELQKQMHDDRFGGDVSVWWIIVRGNLDHEIHHRGQLSVYLRMIEGKS